MKRIASITIFSLVMTGLSATAQAPTITPSVEVNNAVVTGEQTSTIVMVGVTFVCASGTANVLDISISEAGADSSNGVGGSATGSEPVSCNGKPRRIAVSIPNGTPAVPSFNLGKATVTATLKLLTATVASDTETLVIGLAGSGEGGDR